MAMINMVAGTAPSFPKWRVTKPPVRSAASSPPTAQFPADSPSPPLAAAYISLVCLLLPGRPISHRFAVSATRPHLAAACAGPKRTIEEPRPAQPGRPSSHILLVKEASRVHGGRQGLIAECGGPLQAVGRSRSSQTARRSCNSPRKPGRKRRGRSWRRRGRGWRWRLEKTKNMDEDRRLREEMKNKVCADQDAETRKCEKEKNGKDWMVRKMGKVKHPEVPLIINTSPPSSQVHRPLLQPTASSTDQGGSVNVNCCYLHHTHNLIQPMATTQENANHVSCKASSYQQGGWTLEVTSPQYQIPCVMNKQSEISPGPAINSSSCCMDISSQQMQESEHLLEENDYLGSLAAKSIGKLIFEAGLEPGILHLPSFKSMVDALTHGARVAMPTYESILQQQLRDIQHRARELKQHWEQSGCSLILDSWSSQCGKSFISVLVDCSKGILFLRSMDVSAIIDDVDELASMLCHVVDDVGARNIVQVITNNESPHMQAAEHAVLKKHDHSFFFTLCADHCINLLLEKIAALDHFSEVLMKAREITRFLYSHALPMELKGKYIQGREILSSSNLKFVAMFITLERLVSERINLVEMFSSPEWASSDWASRSSFRHICEVVKTDNAFWCSAADILKLTNPLVAVLYKLEGDNCPMGILYDAMDSAKEDIVRNLGHELGDYFDLVDDIWDNYLHTPVHAVGYNLNPRIFYSDRFRLDTEISSGITACIIRMAEGHYDARRLAAQMEVYQRKSGPFDPDSAILQTLGIPQVAWWSAHGTETPELQSFAIRVLSQTCFGASRYNIDWGLSEQLHVVKRTYTEQERFRAREYLHYNLRLTGAVPCVGGDSGAQHGKLTTQLGDWI